MKRVKTPRASVSNTNIKNITDDVNMWFHKVSQYVCCLFEDGVFPGEVMSVSV